MDYQYFISYFLYYIINHFYIILGVPSVEEVCNLFGLTDVQIEYSDEDYQNLTTYKLFQQHVRPLLAKDNPKVPYQS